jgi:hypothetical protein
MWVVDDEQSELRRLQIDEPDTKFEWFNGQRWCNCGSVPNWNIDTKYRVKPKTKVERRWRWRNDGEKRTTLSDYIGDDYAKQYDYKSKGWYKLENDYIDVEVGA